MSDQPEPLSAILAEMHAELDCIDDTKVIPVVYIKNRLPRIEAAAELERVEIRRDAEIEWTRIGYEERKAEEKSAPGNAAALREALEKARSKFIHIKKCADEGEVSRKKLTILCEFVSQEIAAALATSARNCERFNSWEDAYIAWVKETQDCADHPIDWGELPGDAYEAAEELWMHYFADDQNREFCDWLWELEETK